jgi:formate/nitrite transporter FocA (FNT family)
MAVWMALAGRSVTDKAVAIVFPITAFVAAGFEHSIANMYFFPLAMLLGAPLGWADFARNLVPVVAGNIMGGSVLVALVYYVIYLRPTGSRSVPPPEDRDSPGAGVEGPSARGGEPQQSPQHRRAGD